MILLFLALVGGISSSLNVILVFFPWGSTQLFRFSQAACRPHDRDCPNGQFWRDMDLNVEDQLMRALGITAEAVAVHQSSVIAEQFADHQSTTDADHPPSVTTAHHQPIKQPVDDQSSASARPFSFWFSFLRLWW